MVDEPVRINHLDTRLSLCFHGHQILDKYIVDVRSYKSIRITVCEYFCGLNIDWQVALCSTIGSGQIKLYIDFVADCG